MAARKASAACAGEPSASRSSPPCESDSALGAALWTMAILRIKEGRHGWQGAEMKSHTEYLVFETKKRREMVHITPEIERIVTRSGVKDGLCFVSPMHITAAVYVNDLESGLIEDIGKWLEELAPARPDYKHHRTGDDGGRSGGRGSVTRGVSGLDHHHKRVANIRTG